MAEEYLEKTLDYSVRAGTAAQQVLAYEQAESHWRPALALMEQHAIEPGRRAELAFRLGELFQLVGFTRYAAAARYFERAIALYEGAGAAKEAAQIHARLGLLLGAGGPVNDNKAALAHLRAAESFVREGPPSEAQLSLYATFGLVAVWQVEPDEGLAASATAMEIGLSLSREDTWVSNAVTFSFHLQAMGRLAESFDLLEEAWQTADRLNNPFRAFVAASWTGNRLRDMGDPLRARVWLQREVDKPRQLQSPSRHKAILNLIMGTYAQVGDLATCRDLQAKHDLTPKTGELLSWSPLEVEICEGNWEHARDLCRREREKAIAIDHKHNISVADHHLAYVCRLTGDFDEAIDCLLEEQRIGIEGPHALFELRSSMELAILYSNSGKSDEAHAHLDARGQFSAGGKTGTALPVGLPSRKP